MEFKKRAAGFITNFFGGIFYKFFNFISSAKIPDNLMTMTLMKKKLKVNLINLMKKKFFSMACFTLLVLKKEEF